MVSTSKLYLVLAVAFFVSLIFVWSKKFHRKLNPDEQTVIGITVTFATLVFSLLLGFTISGFSDRYFTLRNVLLNEVANLQITYRLIHKLPGSEPVVTAMRDYVQSVIRDEWPALKRDELSPTTDAYHNRLDEAIATFVQANPNNPISSTLLSRLTTNERANRLASRRGVTFLVAVVILSALLCLVGFWYLGIEHKTVQFLVDFGIIAIVFVGLYLLYILQQPFNDSEVTLSPIAYENLLQEVKGGLI